MNKNNRKNGFSQILILIIISFLAIALPITTKLVQKVQENRSSAMDAGECDSGDKICRSGYWYKCNTSHKYAKTTETCATGSVQCIYTYNAWGTCVNGVQTRTYKTKVPSNCTTEPALKRTCTSDSTYYSYYYDASTKTCKATSTKYTSITSCKSSVGSNCYTSESECKNSNGDGGKECVDNYGTHYKSGLGACGTDPGRGDYTYKCSNGSWGAATKCEFGCKNGVCNKTATPSTYYYGSSCSSGTFNTSTECASKNSVCYDTIQACQNAHPCTHWGYFIPLNTSKCFNSIIGSYNINCTSSGKTTSHYPRLNCEGVPDVITNKTCSYGGKTYDANAEICANNPPSSGVNPWWRSILEKCIDGKWMEVARFTAKNCVDGNVVPEVEIEDATSDIVEDTTNTGNLELYYGPSCIKGTFSGYQECNSKGYSCFRDLEDCRDYYTTKYTVYTKGGCDSSTGDFKCTKMTNSTTAADGINTFKDESSCKAADGCSKYSYTPNGPSNPTAVCTANTVSTTECYDSTHLKKCDSAGTAWIQGDQCATGQTCQNGTCSNSSTVGGTKLSFKIAFMGVKPNPSCLENFKTVAITVGKVGTTLSQDLSVSVTGIGETNSSGYGIFKAENVALGTGFSGVSNIYVKIKGLVHSRMYYCSNNQSTKNSSQTCSVATDGTMNNFYDYPILAGDVDQNGIVNVLDFGLIRKSVFVSGCSKGDLNGDSVVNDFDIKLYKVALEAKYDE